MRLQGLSLRSVTSVKVMEVMERRIRINLKVPSTVTLINGKGNLITTSGSGTTVTLSSSSTVGMKRPPSDIITPASEAQGEELDSADQVDSDSGDPKKKKMKKSSEIEGGASSTTSVSSPAMVINQASRAGIGSGSGKQGKGSSILKDKHNVGATSDSTGSKPMEVDSDSGVETKTNFSKGEVNASCGGAAPKVPSIKIVLQSHGSHGNTGASGSSNTDQDGSGMQTSSPTGFPYVVSTSPNDANEATAMRNPTSPSQSSNVTSSQNVTMENPVEDKSPTANEPRTEAITPPPTGISADPVLPVEASTGNLSTSSSQNRAGSGDDKASETASPDQGSLILSLNEKDVVEAEKIKKEETSGIVIKEEKNRKDIKSGSLAPSSLSGNGPASNSSGSYIDEKEKEKPTRVTRSSLRTAHGGPCQTNTGTPNSPSASPKGSPSPNQQDAAEGLVTVKQEVVEKQEEPTSHDHPKKRKQKKPIEPQQPATAPTPPEPVEIPQSSSSNPPDSQPILNCFEMYFNIRKQIDHRRKSLFPVTPKPPQGFKDYLMNRGSYVLASNANKSRVAVPILNPPPSLSSQMKEMFIDQEKERHKLRIQHLIEKEKLVLSVEQEILRVHGRAARALSNQALPFSVCTILKDQEVYNLLTPEQEEKDRNARSRYNGRLFLSWLQDVDDKWDKIKESMLLRHHNEAESLHAAQKMDWEWKLKEVGLCEPKATPAIDDIQVPMVHVSDDFDLLPA